MKTNFSREREITNNDLLSIFEDFKRDGFVLEWTMKSPGAPFSVSYELSESEVQDLNLNLLERLNQFSIES